MKYSDYERVCLMPFFVGQGSITTQCVVHHRTTHMWLAPHLSQNDFGYPNLLATLASSYIYIYICIYIYTVQISAIHYNYVADRNAHISNHQQKTSLLFDVLHFSSHTSDGARCLLSTALATGLFCHSPSVVDRSHFRSYSRSCQSSLSLKSWASSRWGQFSLQIVRYLTNLRSRNNVRYRTFLSSMMQSYPCDWLMSQLIIGPSAGFQLFNPLPN